MAPRPVVVIPLYKADLNPYEWISLRRALVILGTHAITLLIPSSKANRICSALATSLPQGSLDGLDFHLVDDRWLASVATYNHLLLQGWFYERYIQFSHLLIVQLDAYVFRDELMNWCREPWAYIGAPIYFAGSQYGEKNCWCIGAGGFSLRRLDDFHAAFTANPVLFLPSHLMERLAPFNWRGKLLVFLRYLRFLLKGDNRLQQQTNELMRSIGLLEDEVFGKLLPDACPWFHVPTYADARSFAIDRHVAVELAALGRLPFGCHAWWTIGENLTAWRPHIPELND